MKFANWDGSIFERCFCKLDEFGTNYIVFVNGDFKV